jgi:uncharacterized membrane protein
VFAGQVPYRDFFMEYPPGALAVFLPPEIFGNAHYNAAFKTLMTLCGAATIVVLALLLLGPISLNTYDAWPAFLSVAALAVLLAAWPVAAFALLGLAFAAKVYPVVLVPPALTYVWRTAGRRVALWSVATFAAVAAAVIVPFLALSPHGLAESFRAQAARALQVESLGGALLGVADRLGWYSAHVVHRTGHAISYDLVGTVPRVLAGVSSFLQIAAVLGVAWLYWRGRDEPQRLAAAFAAAVAGFLAFTRFFSPQYLVWLLPLVLLLQPLEWALTAAALVLAQLWFFHYRDVFALGGYVWLVALRDVLLLLLFAVLCRRTVEDEHAVVLEDEAPVRVPT